MQLNDVEMRKPSSGEVKLAVKASGLNRAETMMRENTYIVTPELPSGLGYDASAEIIEDGPDVSGFSVGDRAITFPAFSQSKNGVYGEEAIVPKNACWPWPENLTAEEAACVGTNYTTVYFGLKHVGRLNAGDTILLTAATGGVGFAAIEIAKEMGATIIATTRKRNKVKTLLDAGADHVIVTGEEDLVARVQEITDGVGVQVAFDAIAGAVIPQLFECLEQGDRCVIYGIVNPSSPPLDVIPFMIKGLTLFSHAVVYFTGYPDMGLPQNVDAMNEAKEFLLPRLADGRIKPKVSEVFKLEDVADAHRALESNNQVGEIVLTVG
ncbi:MAG: zinc-binding dehydrogenase [Rhodobacteraceae bacterium]|nr:zinc-binding dehydrogenase [Paracoccaceae bacterium]